MQGPNKAELNAMVERGHRSAINIASTGAYAPAPYAAAYAASKAYVLSFHPSLVGRGQGQWRESGDGEPGANADTDEAGDYTYRRPGRRTPSLGGRVVLPSPRRPLPQVAVVVDTSGSVSDRDLGSALSEVAGISCAVGSYGNRIAVYSCDAAVHTVQRVCSAEEITLAGGGGTDLRKGIDRAMAATPRPDVTVVLTDGGTPWPARAPDCRVVAGIFGSSPRYHEDSDQVGPAVPDWAETVYLR